jgi:hypothetical protein
MKIDIQYMKRKTLALMVTRDGKVLVKAPNRTPEKYITDFVQSKMAWISKKVSHVSNSQNLIKDLNLEEIDKQKQKKESKRIISEAVNHWSTTMGLAFKNIRISSARTRWGSCSHQNTISINWRLSLLPPELLEYVVIHELAHIKEKNHSSKFWDLVEQYCPDWKQKRLELKKYGSILELI